MNVFIHCQNYRFQTERSLVVELSVDLPAQESEDSELWKKRFENGYIDPVSEIIFSLYDGILSIETKDHRLVSRLTLPLVEMEKADGE